MGGGDMSTTVSINGQALGLQAAVDVSISALNMLGLKMDQMSAQSDATSFMMGNLGQAFEDSDASLGAMLTTFGSSGSLLDTFTGGIDGLVEGIGGMVEQAGAFITAMAGWAIIQQAISWVQQLADELFNLQVQTQKALVGWSYLLGGGPSGQGTEQSQQLMQWLSVYSLKSPFTKMDAESAATALISMGGSDEAQTQALIPAIADIAATYGSATHGGQGTTLAQAAYAIAMFAKGGYSRMLKMDLGITPEELLPYGLQATGSGMGLHITDPNSVYRAIMAFDQARVPGAAQGIASTTWWGEWSSFQDNVQNFLTMAGGTQMNGTVAPGSLFDNLQKHLSSLLDWAAVHKDEISGFADMISHLLGDVTNAGSGLLAIFIDQLRQLDAVDFLRNGITNLDNIIAYLFGQDPQPSSQSTQGGRRQASTHQGLTLPKGVPDWLPELEQALKGIADLDWSGVTSFFQGIMSLGSNTNFTHTLRGIGDFAAKMNASITPEERQALDQLLGMLGSGTMQFVLLNLRALADGFIALDVGLAHLAPFLVSTGQFFSTIGWWFQDVGRRAQYLKTELDPVWNWFETWVLSAVKFASPFYTLQQAIDGLVQSLRNLTGIKPPSWWPSWLGGGPTTGNSVAPSVTSTRVPGGFRNFGVVGAAGTIFG